MNPEIKTKWLEALRSGDYKQGTRSLKYADGDQVKHCCLGVLSELAVAEGVVEALGVSKVRGASPGLYPDGTYAFGADTATAYLPIEVRDWAGLEHGNPTIPPTGPAGADRCTSLAGLNDNGGTFEDIARVIEENF